MRSALADALRLASDSIADRATLTAHYLQASEAEQASERPSRRMPAVNARPTSSLAQQVERIMKSSSPPQRPTDPNQVAIQSESLPRPPRTPSIPVVETDPTPPPSSRVHERPSGRFQATVRGATGDKSRR